MIPENSSTCNRDASVMGINKRKEQLFCPLLKLPRKQRMDTLTESVHMINLGVFVFIFSFCLSHPTHDIYLDTKRSCVKERLPHYSSISMCCVSINIVPNIFRQDYKKETERAKAAGQCLPIVNFLVTNRDLPSKNKTLLYGKKIPEAVWKQVAWQFFQSNSNSLSPYRLSSLTNRC